MHFSIYLEQKKKLKFADKLFDFSRYVARRAGKAATQQYKKQLSAVEIKEGCVY